MSTPSRLTRWLHTLIGELPPPHSREERSGLLWMVGFWAFVAMVLGEFKDLRGPPLSHGAWRGMAHGAIPLIGIALWELRETRRGRASALLGSLLICSVFVVQYGMTGGRIFLRETPWAVMGPALLGSGLLLYGLRRGGARLSDWGLTAGDTKFWVPRTLIAIAVLIPLLFAVVYLSPKMAAYYPHYRPGRKDLLAFSWLSFGHLMDFVGWEFFFRGFLLFAIARRGDVMLAILLQAIPFFLLHSGKPHLELVMSFFGGLVSGWFCYRARTFYPLLILHWVQLVTVGLAANLYRWYL